MNNLYYLPQPKRPPILASEDDVRFAVENGVSTKLILRSIDHIFTPLVDCDDRDVKVERCDRCGIMSVDILRCEFKESRGRDHKLMCVHCIDEQDTIFFGG
jgi:hypothetical protein